MKPLSIPVKNTSGLSLPQYQTEGAAGFDFVAAVDQPVTIQPSMQAIIPTGIYVALPVGYELQVRGRSGIAAKYGIGLTNGVGTIDSDYRGEIQIILRNFGSVPFVIKRGDRIAQGIVSKYERVEWQATDNLDLTDRGNGRFGSTG